MCSHLCAVPYLHVRDGSVEVAIFEPGGSAKPVLSASRDVWLVSVSLGADEDAVLVHRHASVLNCHHNMRPCGGVKVTRGEVLVP